MLGTAVSATGIFLTGIGTIVRVAPDMDRRYRRWFYSNAPLVKGLFQMREDIKHSDRGWNFTVESKRVCKEFIDYTDAHDVRDPPDEVPVSVTNVAASLEIELPNGDKESYPQGTFGKRILVELITSSIDRTCRNYGLGIAVFGAGLTILGTFI